MMKTYTSAQAGIPNNWFLVDPEIPGLYHPVSHTDAAYYPDRKQQDNVLPERCGI